MNLMHKNGQQKIKLLPVNKSVTLSLILSSILMGCASGTPKIEAWKFNEEAIQAVKEKCTGTFSESSGGKFSALWANKRAILREARDCAGAARILAQQAEARNRVISP